MNSTPEMKSKPASKWLVVVKILISVLAFYMAFRMVGQNDLKLAFKRVDKVLFFAAALLYLLSQGLSSERLRLFISKFKGGHHVSSLWNARLYLVGMAYNLFLPGGIGGDAYKLLVYNKKLKSGKRRVFIALLLDRFSGLLAIGLLIAFVGIYRSPQFYGYYPFLWWIPAIAAGILAFFVIKKQYKRFHFIFLPALTMSVLIQAMQVGCMLLLAHAVGISDHQAAIAVVFLLSSFATAIPVFLGGLGAREVVFASMAVAFSYPAPEAVLASLLFSGIIVLTALPGLLLSLKKY